MWNLAKSRTANGQAGAAAAAQARQATDDLMG